MGRGLLAGAVVALLSACGNGGFSEVDDVPKVQAYGAIWSFAADDVYVTAEAGRLLHYNGSGWKQTQLDTTDTMLGIWAFARDDVWMVGGDTLARYDGSAWSITDLRAENSGIEGLNAIWGSAPDDVWVVGTQSTAAHWDGAGWRRYIAAGTENTAVWGSGPDDVYVLGDFGVAHWDGGTFSDVELDLFSGTGIWGSGPDNVWIADEESLAHWVGDEWKYSELDGISGPSALWGRSKHDIWGVGQFGYIGHYDGSWEEVDSQKPGSPYLRTFTRVHGSDDGDVWVAGAEYGTGGVKPLLWRRDAD